VLREGYGLDDFRADLVAGLTVAVVALPLSMAIAIASGVTPDRGLYAAVVGGFLVSLLGGSRFQIGGPAGAFIVLVFATVERHGVDGLLLATMMSGVLLTAMGLLRLGTYIKFIPFPVTVGFTAGIAIIILASQLKELLGLTLGGKEPSAMVPKLEALWAALPSLEPAVLTVSTFTLAVILLLRRIRPHWPGMLIAVFAAAVAGWTLQLPVETIGSQFGGIPRTLPVPALPELDTARLIAILPDALAFTLLGAIESLLSAVVADGMTGRRHRSNCELVAQGAANVASGLFGGICVTGTIARTATNVRAGARGPVAGMLHSLALLLFMLIAAPLAAYIPLASLAAVLVFVAWNMVERSAIVALFRSSWGDATVFSATFLLTVFRDLTEGIVVGFAIGALLFLNRMSRAITVESAVPMVAEDQADATPATGRAHYDAGLASDPGVVVYRISGAFFFGSASTVAAVLDRIADQPKTFVLDFAAVPFLDSTAANTIEIFIRKAVGRGKRVIVSGTNTHVRQTLFTHGVRPPNAAFKRSVDSALKAIRKSDEGPRREAHTAPAAH
jgi:SulP family sulfate permease